MAVLMRHAAFALALCAVGCNDYDVLRTDICVSALAKGAMTPAALCDDFEQPAGKIDSSLWIVPPTGATTYRPVNMPDSMAGANTDGTPTNAYHGDFTALLTDQISEDQQSPTLYSPTAPNRAFGLRMFVWFAVLPRGHLELVRLEDGIGNLRYAVSLEDGVLTLTEITDLVATPVTPPHAVPLHGQLGLQQWLCIELDVQNGIGDTVTTAPEMDFFLMGSLTAVPALALPPSISKTFIGPSRGEGVPSSDKMWVDEVILANKHIGCDE